MYTHLDGPHSRVPVGKYKIGLIAQERKPHLTNAVVGDPRVSDQEWAQREGMVAFAGYPLVVDDRLVGVMAMFARHAADRGDPGGDGVGGRRDRRRDRAEDRPGAAATSSGSGCAVTLASIGDAVIATDDRGAGDVPQRRGRRS